MVGELAPHALGEEAFAMLGGIADRGNMPVNRDVAPDIAMDADKPKELPRLMAFIFASPRSSEP